MNREPEDAALSRYIERVKRIPVLDRETEHELACKALAGDAEAREKLVEANLRYVIAVALQYRRYGIRVSDLIAEGNLGLMTAVRKFDPERGTRFVTYAGYWIRAYVLDLIVKSTTMVGAGSGPLRSKLFFRLRRERARVANLAGDHSERLSMLAERFKTTPEKIEEMTRRLDARDLSLDAETFEDSRTTLVETLMSPNDSQEVRFIDAEEGSRLSQSVDAALRLLDPRERFIVEKRMLEEDEMSLAAIGRKLGVSRERARQLEVRAKKKLREQLNHFAPVAA